MLSFKTDKDIKNYIATDNYRVLMYTEVFHRIKMVMLGSNSTALTSYMELRYVIRTMKATNQLVLRNTTTACLNSTVTCRIKCGKVTNYKAMTYVGFLREKWHRPRDVDGIVCYTMDYGTLQIRIGVVV